MWDRAGWQVARSAGSGKRLQCREAAGDSRRRCSSSAMDGQGDAQLNVRWE